MFRKSALALAAALSVASVFALPACLPDAPGVGRASAAQPELPVNLTIENTYDNTVTIYWVNRQGQLQYYKTLGARESYLQQTYSTHKWVAVIEGTGVRQTFITPQFDSVWSIR
jgi:hypothetical protein